MDLQDFPVKKWYLVITETSLITFWITRHDECVHFEVFVSLRERRTLHSTRKGSTCRNGFSWWDPSIEGFRFWSKDSEDSFYGINYKSKWIENEWSWISIKSRKSESRKPISEFLNPRLPKFQNSVCRIPDSVFRIGRTPEPIHPDLSDPKIFKTIREFQKFTASDDFFW